LFVYLKRHRSSRLDEPVGGRIRAKLQVGPEIGRFHDSNRIASEPAEARRAAVPQQPHRIARDNRQSALSRPEYVLR
jgi:hypothetical protein